MLHAQWEVWLGDVCFVFLFFYTRGKSSAKILLEIWVNTGQNTGQNTGLTLCKHTLHHFSGSECAFRDVMDEISKKTIDLKEVSIYYISYCHNHHTLTQVVLRRRSCYKPILSRRSTASGKKAQRIRRRSKLNSHRLHSNTQ